ncbi:MAG: hypothetical protein AB7O38_12725, partial [Pirellulaceae bacterium]
VGTTRSLPDLPIPADPRVTFVPTQESGVYEFSFPGSTAQGSPRKVAVNGDTRESDPARVEPEMLPSGFAKRESDLATDAPVAAERSKPLFRGLLVIVLALLLGESVLAGWFARRDL